MIPEGPTWLNFIHKLLKEEPAPRGVQRGLGERRWRKKATWQAGLDLGAWGFCLWHEAACLEPLAQLALLEFLDSSVTGEADTPPRPLSFPGRVWPLFWRLVVGFPWGCLSLVIALISVGMLVVPKLAHLRG